MFFELQMVGSWKLDFSLTKLLNLTGFETLLCTLRSCNQKGKQNHVVVIQCVSFDLCWRMYVYVAMAACRSTNVKES